MNQKLNFDKKVRTDIVSPVFTDGMVVTAGDLDRAMHYPVELFQALFGAYFGCGVVCGYAVERYPARDDNCDDKWCVVIHPGTALDCAMHPLKICDCVKLCLEPDPCFCGEFPTQLCIAIRRCTAPEGPRDDVEACDSDSKSGKVYRRSREYVEIKVYDPSDCDLPKLCIKEPASDKHRETCDCLKECPDCSCGECWVVLACVEIDECDGIGKVTDQRKWVKPVHCHCQCEEKTEAREQTDENGDAWVVLSSGEFKSGNQSGMKNITQPNEPAHIAQVVQVKRRRGVLVGYDREAAVASPFVAMLQKANKSKCKEQYEMLRSLNYEDRKKHIDGY